MRSRYLVFGVSSLVALALAVPAFGGPSNPIATSAKSVRTVANKALKTAKGAKTAATTAQTAATKAQTTADQATTAAAAANTNANNRLRTVDHVQGTTSVTDSLDKGAAAVCAGASEATGGGYFVTGAGTNDVTAQFNSSYGDAWLVNIEEIDYPAPGGPTTGTWAVTTTIECASK